MGVFGPVPKQHLVVFHHPSYNLQAPRHFRRKLPNLKFGVEGTCGFLYELVSISYPYLLSERGFISLHNSGKNMIIVNVKKVGLLCSGKANWNVSGYSSSEYASHLPNKNKGKR